MAGLEASVAAARSVRRRDLLYAAHSALVASLAIGWTLRWIQATTLTSETSFVTSPFGRGLALVAMVVGLGALGAILVLTVIERAEIPAIALLILLLTALWSRAGPDAPDVLYALAAIALGGRRFLGRRHDRKPLGSH